jgi:hypothetical protein
MAHRVGQRVGMCSIAGRAMPVTTACQNSLGEVLVCSLSHGGLGRAGGWPALCRKAAGLGTITWRTRLGKALAHTLSHSGLGRACVLSQGRPGQAECTLSHLFTYPCYPSEPSLYHHYLPGDICDTKPGRECS